MNLELIKEFEEMKAQPIFEINLADYLELEEDEYVIYYLQVNEEGIEAGGCSNCGFYPYADLFVEWEDNKSLDYHLERLYELCLDYVITDYLEENNENKFQGWKLGI